MKGMIKMASGAPTPGGIKLNPAGGLQEVKTGGINSDNWRIFQGHVSVDPFGPLNSSGARVIQTRGVRNARKDAKSTGVTYAWTLPTVPGGSTTATGSITGGSTQTATFTPDVAGTYVFRNVATFTGSGKTVTTNFTYVSA
jgi:hypothetical protein